MADPSNKSRRISLVLADVDGTLVTKDKILTERAREAVRRLREMGIRFAITSGRPPRGMEMLIKPLALDLPVAGFNGGMFANPDLSIIEEKRLPRDIAEKSMKMLLDAKLDAWVYTGNDWMIRDAKAPHVERETHTVQFDAKVMSSFDDFMDKAVKIVGISDDLELMKKTEADVQKALGDQATAARSQPYYLDITHKEANKGFVVDYLARLLKIPAQEIATMGDQPNDVTMFKRSGLSIAMGNSPDEVKNKASEVTDSYDDEGFAKAIEKFILQKDLQPSISEVGNGP